MSPEIAPVPQRWPTPSERVRELISGFARATIQDLDPVFEIVDQAVIDATPERVRADSALTDAMREANHRNLTHWMAANVSAPGERVPPNAGGDVLDLARDIVRRGYDDTSLNSYRIGQNAALRYLMNQIFEVTDDVDLIRELLDVASLSIFTFVDDTLAEIEQQIGVEREQLERGTHAQRLATVNLILEGAPIGPDRAAARLGYELSGPQRAAVIWTDERDGSAALERTADQLARAAGASRPFTVAASARSLWVWFSPRAAVVSEEASLPAEADSGRPPVEELEVGVRVAIGSDGVGFEGFRRSHFHALTTQGLMRRAAHSKAIASFGEIELVALTAGEEELAVAFARRTLGGLLDADPSLRETLLAYIRNDFNSSAAARSLFAHRNTVLNRLERARELLPGTVEGRGLEIGLALEIGRWLGLGAEEA